MHLCRSGFLLCLFCVKNTCIHAVRCLFRFSSVSIGKPIAFSVFASCYLHLCRGSVLWCGFFFFWLECLVLMDGAVDRVFFKSLHIGRFFVDTALCVMFELYNCLLLAQFYSLWFQFPAVNQGAKLLDGNFQKLIKILIYFNIYYNLIIDGYCSLL